MWQTLSGMRAEAGTVGRGLSPVAPSRGSSCDGLTRQGRAEPRTAAGPPKKRRTSRGTTAKPDESTASHNLLWAVQELRHVGYQVLAETVQASEYGVPKSRGGALAKRASERRPFLRSSHNGNRLCPKRAQHSHLSTTPSYHSGGTSDPRRAPSTKVGSSSSAFGPTLCRARVIGMACASA